MAQTVVILPSASEDVGSRGIEKCLCDDGECFSVYGCFSIYFTYVYSLKIMYIYQLYSRPYPLHKRALILGLDCDMPNYLSSKYVIVL